MSRISALMLDIQTAVQSIAQLQNRVIFVNDTNELIEKTKAAGKFPFVGIVYEGTRKTERPQPTSNLGVSNEVVASLIIMTTGDYPLQQKNPYATVDLLDEIRGSLLGKTNPSGHKWGFVVEAPADVKNNVTFWVQRWSTPIQYAPKF